MTEKKDLSLEKLEEKLKEVTREKEAVSQEINVEENKLIQNIEMVNQVAQEGVEEAKIETNLSDYLVLSDSFYAGFWIRFGAYIIDAIVITALGKLLNTITFGLLDFGYELPVIDKAFPVAIAYFLYFILMTYILGQTLGKMIMGIKVETNTGDKLSFSDVIYRELVGRTINAALFMLPYEIVAFTRKKKGLHDYIADTVVIKEKYSIIRRKLNTLLQGEK